MDSVILITESDTVEINTVEESVIEVLTDETQVLEVVTEGPQGIRGIQGIQGIQGDPGHSFTTYPAGTALGGHRMVALIDGEFVYADHTNPAHIAAVVGMTTGAVNQGDFPTVVTDGEITEPTWTLTKNTAFYLSENGLISTTAPSSGFVLECGLATSDKSIFIHIGKAWVKG